VVAHVTPPPPDVGDPEWPRVVAVTPVIAAVGDRVVELSPREPERDAPEPSLLCLWR
jgi:hypothetical protein